MKEISNEEIVALLQERKVILEGRIDQEEAKRIRACLLYLVSLEDAHAPITLSIVDSSGGDARPGLALYEVISSLGTDVCGEVRHEANSIATLVLQACTRRLAHRSASFTIHDNDVEIKGTVKTLRKHFSAALDAAEKRQQKVYEIFAYRTRRSVEEIEEACGKTTRMTAHEAKRFGLIDEVI